MDHAVLKQSDNDVIFIIFEALV